MIVNQKMATPFASSYVLIAAIFGLLISGLFLTAGILNFFIFIAGVAFVTFIFKTPFWGLCLLLFSLPFSGMLQFAGEGVFLTTANKLLGYLLLAAFAFKFIHSDDLGKISFSGSMIGFFLFSLWCLISLFWADDKSEIVKTVLFRFNLVGLAFLVSEIPKSLKRFKTLCFCATAGAASLGIYVVVMGLESLAGEYGYRLAASTNENTLAHSLAVALLLSFFAYRDSGKVTKTVIVLLDFFILYGIFLTGSRGTWVALLFSAILAPLFFPGIQLRRKLLFSSIVGAGIAFLYFGLTHNMFGEHVEGVVQRIYMISPEAAGGRIEFIWPFYLEQFFTNPVFGAGLGFGYYSRFAAHNDMLFILSEIGLVGMMLFATMQWMFLKDSINAKDSWNRMLLIVLLLFLFTSGLTHNTISWKSYVVSVGVFSFFGSYEKKKALP